MSCGDRPLTLVFCADNAPATPVVVLSPEDIDSQRNGPSGTHRRVLLTEDLVAQLVGRSTVTSRNACRPTPSGLVAVACRSCFPTGLSCPIDRSSIPIRGCH